VEPVAPQPGRLEPAGDRHEPGDARQVVVERRVEARDLGQGRVEPAERLDEVDLPRQVLRVVRADPPKLGEQVVGDGLRLEIPAAAVDHAVPDRRECGEPHLAIDPLDQQPRGRPMVRCLDRGLADRAADADGGQPRAGQADPLDPARGPPRGRVGPIEQRELQAGRPAVDRQDERPARRPRRQVARPVLIP
jgi:hypothetical protein